MRCRTILAITLSAWWLLSVALLAPVREARAADPPSAAAQALLVEVESGRVLFARQADAAMAPSSLTKLMTAYLVFRALETGRISLDTRFPVSVEAWRKGGSRMFLEPKSQARVRDLLRGLLVQSGNDAAIVLAEGLAGSETAFAEDMNATARRMGLTGSHFVNASGWPEPGHVSTARDIARLAIRLIADFPQYYGLFAERAFTWNGITQANRNPVLGRVAGADGLKTGHTEAGGYGVAASAQRQGRRLVLVINGLASDQARRREAAALLDWGFAQFEAVPLAYRVGRKPRPPTRARLMAVRPQRKPAFGG